MSGITNIRKITTFSEHKFFRKKRKKFWKNAKNFGKTQKILEKRKNIGKNKCPKTQKLDL